MKTRLLTILAGLSMACLLAGCVTTAERQAYLNEFQSRGVDATVYAKIERKRTLQIADLEELLKKQVPEPVIIVHLKRTQAIYTLKTGDIERLRNAGATDELVNFLLSTPELFGHQFPPYYWGHPYYYTPFYFYDYRGYPYHHLHLHYRRP